MAFRSGTAIYTGGYFVQQPGPVQSKALSIFTGGWFGSQLASAFDDGEVFDFETPVSLVFDAILPISRSFSSENPLSQSLVRTHALSASFERAVPIALIHTAEVATSGLRAQEVDR